MKFVNWLDEDLYFRQNEMDMDDQPRHAWVITRGAEMCDQDFEGW